MARGTFCLEASNGPESLSHVTLRPRSLDRLPPRLKDDPVMMLGPSGEPKVTSFAQGYLTNSLSQSTSTYPKRPGLSRGHVWRGCCHSACHRWTMWDRRTVWRAQNGAWPSRHDGHGSATRRWAQPDCSDVSGSCGFSSLTLDCADGHSGHRNRTLKSSYKNA